MEKNQQDVSDKFRHSFMEEIEKTNHSFEQSVTRLREVLWLLASHTVSSMYSQGNSHGVSVITDGDLKETMVGDRMVGCGARLHILLRTFWRLEALKRCAIWNTIAIVKLVKKFRKKTGVSSILNSDLPDSDVSSSGENREYRSSSNQFEDFNETTIPSSSIRTNEGVISPSINELTNPLVPDMRNRPDKYGFDAKHPLTTMETVKVKYTTELSERIFWLKKLRSLKLPAFQQSYTILDRLFLIAQKDTQNPHNKMDHESERETPQKNERIEETITSNERSVGIQSVGGGFKPNDLIECVYSLSQSRCEGCMCLSESTTALCCSHVLCASCLVLGSLVIDIPQNSDTQSCILCTQSRKLKRIPSIDESVKNVYHDKPSGMSILDNFHRLLYPSSGASHSLGCHVPNDGIQMPCDPLFADFHPTSPWSEDFEKQALYWLRRKLDSGELDPYHRMLSSYQSPQFNANDATVEHSKATVMQYKKYCPLCCELLVNDETVSTSCDHHFHKICLSRLDVPICPVCNEMVSDFRCFLEPSMHPHVMELGGSWPVCMCDSSCCELFADSSDSSKFDLYKMFFDHTNHKFNSYLDAIDYAQNCRNARKFNNGDIYQDSVKCAGNHVVDSVTSLAGGENGEIKHKKFTKLFPGGPCMKCRGWPLRDPPPIWLQAMIPGTDLHKIKSYLHKADPRKIGEFISTSGSFRLDARAVDIVAQSRIPTSYIGDIIELPVEKEDVNDYFISPQGMILNLGGYIARLRDDVASTREEAE